MPTTPPPPPYSLWFFTLIKIFASYRKRQNYSLHHLYVLYRKGGPCMLICETVGVVSKDTEKEKFNFYIKTV